MHARKHSRTRLIAQPHRCNSALRRAGAQVHTSVQRRTDGQLHSCAGAQATRRTATQPHSHTVAQSRSRTSAHPHIHTSAHSHSRTVAQLRSRAAAQRGYEYRNSLCAVCVRDIVSGVLARMHMPAVCELQHASTQEQTCMRVHFTHKLAQTYACTNTRTRTRAHAPARGLTYTEQTCTYYRRDYWFWRICAEVKQGAVMLLRW